MNGLNPGTATLSLGAALLCVAAAATGCTSGIGGGTGGGGAGGTTSASTTGASTTGASAGTGENLCGVVGYPCCAGGCSQMGAVCLGNTCVHVVPFGGDCTQNEVCESGLCLGSGHCSRPCASAADCPPAPEWTCESSANYPTDMCQCAPSGPEVCDGEDNDCNGGVDDGATCAQAGFTCQSGACACDPAGLCNGVCKDLASDLQNCGGCGTICAAGAACFEGHCQTTLATGQSPAALAVDATHLYWTNNDGGTSNAVMKVPVGGGALVTLATGQVHPNHLALDASNVYWTDGGAGTVMKMPLGGGGSTTLASGQSLVQGVAVDATSVYWLNPTDADGVRKMPLGGGAIVSSDAGQSSAWNIAVDATGVYVVGMGGALTRVPLGGGAPTELAPRMFKGTRTNSVALDATHVYWTSDDAVMKMPLAGGATTILASGQTTPGGLAVDGVNVYWTDGSGVGTVMKMPVGGGAVTTLASGQAGPFAITVDATSVYWTAGDSIKKAPK